MQPFWPLLAEVLKPTTPKSVNKRRASHGQESNLQTAQTTRSLKPLTKADRAQWISNQSQKLEAGKRRAVKPHSRSGLAVVPSIHGI